jgi:hypothetical protein
MDTVTGRITYYTATGGEFDSIGAEQAVASNPLVRQGRLTPTQPILYNAFGENTWVVPLVADTGKYQTLALVEAKNGRVVVGNSSSPSPQRDALDQYRALLGGATVPGAPAGGTAFSGTIDRIANAGGVIYFTLQDDRHIFVLSQADDPRVLLARSGDRVTFHASPDASGRLTVRDFRDRSLPP